MWSWRITLIVLLHCSSLWAQTQETPEARFQALEERIRALEAQVQSLQAQLAGTATPAPPTVTVRTDPATSDSLQGQATTLPVYGKGESGTKVLNPDISVVGNIMMTTGQNPQSPLPALSLRETEFGFQSIIDPYARADVFLSISEEGAEVEEGYVTFPALPGGVSLRAGKMRAAFGKMNPLHNHVLPWLDRPLLAFNLLGGDPAEGDAGINDIGLSLGRIVPAPGNLFLEATAEVYRGNSGSLFQSSRRSQVSTIGRLKAYHDLNESTNLEGGGSYARGHNDLGAVTQLFGIDTTLRWKPLRRAIYHSFVARAELAWSRLRQPAAIARSHGWFAAADYQLGRRWFVGTRFDWSQRSREPGLHDSGKSFVLTFRPSEFSQIRGQLRRTNYAEGFAANELLFQLQYAIGAHGAHPF
jgi:hypothetical protein